MDRRHGAQRDRAGRLTRKRLTGDGGDQDLTHWVFAYGSLIWRADFPWLERRPAWIDGWARRFWQGSHDHRGRPDAPGRVVTLIAAPGARCDGRAYRVAADVFAHLDHREKNGYRRQAVTLHFADAAGATDGVVYIAAPGNFAFLGDAPLDEIAAQIHRSHGPSGANVEYLCRLAAALRELGSHDEHVFELERRVLALSAPD